MKISPAHALIGLSSLFTSATSSVIPTTPALDKRYYTVNQWSRARSAARSFGLQAHRWDCDPGPPSRTDNTFIHWPIQHQGSFFNDIALCVRTRYCHGAEDMSCPESEEAIIDTIMRQSRENNWNPHIDRDEAYRGLHMLDSAMWPWPSLADRERAAQQESQLSQFGGIPGRVIAAAAAAAGDSAVKVEGVGAPGPTQDGVAGGCTRWHVAHEGNSCYWIAHDNGIQLDQFYGWNPAVNNGGTCAGLWLGYAYCVGL